MFETAYLLAATRMEYCRSKTWNIPVVEMVYVY